MPRRYALTIHVHGKPVGLTVATIRATWQWFADNARACAREAQAGAFHVNNLASYVANEEANAAEYDAKAAAANIEGLSLTFIQRAYYIQSGESVPLLA